MNQCKKIHIGTSGWNYKHWRGTFYPEDIPERKWLEYYSNKFLTVELNSSFYSLPKEKSVLNWHNSTPENFLFSCKASRFITHIKKLNEPEESLTKFFNSIAPLKEKLGIVLFQLPPGLSFNQDKLNFFLDYLPDNYSCTIEFRNPEWWRDETFEMLEQRNIAFCIFELGDMHTPILTTSNKVYVRLHGPGKKYKGKYDNTALSVWAERISAWVSEGREVFGYFDNDEKGYAAFNAMDLISIINV